MLPLGPIVCFVLSVLAAATTSEAGHLGATASAPSSAPTSAPATQPAGRFAPVGLGGGGAMFTPASSPHDPNLMFVSCDMGGFYRSSDGGKSWTMLDFRMVRGSMTCRPAFHPKDPGIVYFEDKISRDAGLTWERFIHRDVGTISEIAIDPDDNKVLLVGTDKGAWISRDAGQSWQRCTNVQGSVVGIYIEPLEEGKPGRMFVGTALGIFRSIDGGKTFAEAGEGLPWLQIRSLRAGRAEKTGTILYCTIPSKSVKGRFDGGVYKSVDGGSTWHSAMGLGLNTRMLTGERGGSRMAQYSQLGVAATDGRTVYVVCKGTGPQPDQHDTIYRSEDAGASWQGAYNPDPRDPACNVEHGWLGLTFGWSWGGLASPDGFTVNPAKPNVVMVSNAGELFVTADGGRRWRQAFTRYVQGQEPPKFQKNVGRWASIGLEVTTTWNYDVDPFNHQRHYICYTDVGFAWSEDAGATWHNNSRSSGTPWTNTTYMLAFDPTVKGKAWAAMSNVHDIPHWTYIHDKVKGPGGVCASTDHCQTWKVSSDGLPEAPCTSIVLDPKSPPEARVLYCTMFGQGVYKSIDDGKTWIPKSTGLPENNKHVFLIKRHPDGTLLVCVTGRRQGLKFPSFGGLYRSRDGGDSWQNVTESQPLHWPVGFDFDPKDSNVIYLAAATIPGGREGGLYKTSDGGKGWRRLLRDEDFAGHGGPDYVHAMFVTLDPRRPETLYLGTASQGLWYSHDAGSHWKQFEGIPFAGVQRVAFDPDDAGRIYMTTFGGGIWRNGDSRPDAQQQQQQPE